MLKRMERLKAGESALIEDRRYRVLSLLGHGKGGYSYLVEADGMLCVLKAIHHEPCPYYSFGNKIEAEARDYHILLEVGIPIPKMLFLDKKKEIILKEYIEGPTIFDIVKEGKDASPYIDEVRLLANKAMKKGINIDYFPTNFVVHNSHLFYVDYECNEYKEEWDFEHWGIKYWSLTPEFKAHLEKEEGR